MCTRRLQGRSGETGTILLLTHCRVGCQQPPYLAYSRIRTYIHVGVLSKEDKCALSDVPFCFSCSLFVLPRNRVVAWSARKTTHVQEWVHFKKSGFAIIVCMPVRWGAGGLPSSACRRGSCFNVLFCFLDLVELYSSKQ